MRRALTGLALVAVLATAACGGTSSANDGTSGRSGGSAGPEATGQLTVLAAASLTESFEQLAEGFEQANPGTTVNLNAVPYEQMFENIDAQLQSGTAPDIFRVDYGTLGVYSSQDQLLDLSPYVDDAASEAFIPAFWRAVQFEGTPFGMPHQTDTSAVFQWNPSCS